MATSKFDICSNALTMVGASTITSFEDDSAESVTAGQHYERIVTARLGAHPWGFATELKSLGSKESAPPAGLWDYSWQLPGTLLTLWGVYRADVPVEGERFGFHYFTNEEADLFARYTFRQDEQYWSALFIDAMVQELAALFALTLARNVDLHKSLADGQMSPVKQAWMLARNRDSMGQTTQRLVGQRLTRVRRYGNPGVEGESSA